MCLDLCISTPPPGSVGAGKQFRHWYVRMCLAQVTGPLSRTQIRAPRLPHCRRQDARGGGVAMGQELARVLCSRAARAGNLTSLGGATMSLTLCTIWGYGSGAVRNSPVVAERHHAVFPFVKVHVAERGTK